MSKKISIQGLSLLLVLLVMACKSTQAQSLTAGVDALRHKLITTAVFSTPIAESEKFSFTAIGRYDSSWKGEQLSNMLIGVAGYKISASFSSSAGAYYSYPNGVRPLLSIGYAKVWKHFSLSLLPHIVIQDNPSYLTFFKLQYQRKLTEEADWFICFHPYMVNSISDHYYTSVRYRLGVDRKKLQGGLALDNDYYGNEFSHTLYAGLFMQFTIF